MRYHIYVTVPTAELCIRKLKKVAQKSIKTIWEVLFLQLLWNRRDSLVNFVFAYFVMDLCMRPCGRKMTGSSRPYKTASRAIFTATNISILTPPMWTGISSAARRRQTLAGRLSHHPGRSWDEDRPSLQPFRNSARSLGCKALCWLSAGSLCRTVYWKLMTSIRTYWPLITAERIQIGLRTSSFVSWNM